MYHFSSRVLLSLQLNVFINIHCTNDIAYERLKSWLVLVGIFIAENDLKMCVRSNNGWCKSSRKNICPFFLFWNTFQKILKSYVKSTFEGLSHCIFKKFLLLLTFEQCAHLETTQKFNLKKMGVAKVFVQTLLHFSSAKICSEKFKNSYWESTFEELSNCMFKIFSITSNVRVESTFFKGKKV